MNLNKTEIEPDQMRLHLENLQKTSDFFQLEPVQDIHVFFLYVINQKLENYCRIDMALNEGKLSKNDLLAEILKRKKDDGRNFHITGLYTYNWMEPLTEFINKNTLSTCFHSLPKLDDVEYAESVGLFQDYTSLFVLLQNEKSIKTKRTVEQKKNKTIRKA